MAVCHSSYNGPAFDEDFLLQFEDRSRNQSNIGKEYFEPAGSNNLKLKVYEVYEVKFK